MRAFGLILAPALLGLAACGPPANLEGAQDASFSGEVCNASIYADLVGEPISAVESIQTSLEVRVLGASDFVTKDFNPNRLTLTTTTKDTIGRVFCG